jgi:hypothetical protein
MANLDALVVDLAPEVCEPGGTVEQGLSTRFTRPKVPSAQAPSPGLEA